MASAGSTTVYYPFWALVIGAILSSVFLVIVNKMIFERGFPFVFTLSTFHFIVTAGLLSLMSSSWLKLFEPGYLPFRVNVVVGALGVASITLMNFSLQYNSVGFYQVAKLCVIPAVLFINYFFPTSEESASRKVKGSLVLVLLGVGIASVTDVQLNLVGSIFGILAVLSTAQYQIWQGTKQREAKLNGMQTAASVAFVQIVFGAICAAIFEGQKLLLLLEENDLYLKDRNSDEYRYVRELILLSCLLAVSVNVHSFSMIGRTSAVTWQVVGHGKTCLILISGYIMTPITDFDLFVKNLIGVSIAMLGVILYSNLKLVEGKAGERDWCDQYLPASLLSCFLEPVNSVSSTPSNNQAPQYSTVTQKDEDDDATIPSSTQTEVLSEDKKIVQRMTPQASPV